LGNIDVTAASSHLGIAAVSGDVAESVQERPAGFELLFEQGACLVVGKPGGLLTQAPPGIDDLQTRVRRFLLERERREGNIYLTVAHRLDRPVSGVVILTRNVRAARRVSEQFQRREVRKVYWAAVEGGMATESGTWTDWMRKVPDEPRAELVPADHPEARRAVLHFRTLRTSANWSLLEIELETGRMHQIRLQAASRGWPILGDAWYGATRSFGPEVTDPRQQWIALHARQVGFQHPMTREPVVVTAPWPEVWRELVEDDPQGDVTA
jgi:23S rRNA pseudouridine1911/1915/1917 synthase